MSVSEHEQVVSVSQSQHSQKIAKPSKTYFSVDGLTKKTHFTQEEIDESEWVQGLSVFLRGTLDEHINFCYFIYDINGDRSLAREELYHCLKNCLIRTAGIEEDVEESIKEIVEIALKKLDKDKNGQITFSDFYAAVQCDNLLLEACGPCLPSPKTIGNFFLFLKENYPVVVQSVRGRRGGKSKQGERCSLSATRDFDQGGASNSNKMFRRNRRSSSLSKTP
ncbi:unnamed protein product [Orchesella dallaii]|uniref:EF-hand domain-containing protein n=1 Tax=Orchesella dallaii TaxID=48710 RepID=A0ABP1PZ51_9HEXA